MTGKTPEKEPHEQSFDSQPWNLHSFESFMTHPSMVPWLSRFQTDILVANQAVTRLHRTLDEWNQEFEEKKKRVLFTSISSRVKTQESFFKKLYRKIKHRSTKSGISSSILERLYGEIKDIGGIRFACPYYDEVAVAIEKIIRPRLTQQGYATKHEDPELADKDMMDDGDDFGYRSFHFYVKVPAIVDVFGNTRMFLCEIQGRSELQHIWAVKSHNLLYKDDVGWQVKNPNLLADMKQISNNLRSADHFLAKVKNERRGGSDVEF